VTSLDIATAVRRAVGDALGLVDDEVALGASLRDDLGAFADDLDRIAARVHRSTGVRIDAGDMPLCTVTVANLVALVTGLRRIAAPRTVKA
jgi:hypothetical protein